MKEEQVVINNKERNEDQMDFKNQGIRTSTRPKRFPNTRSDDFFIGIISDMAVCESSANIAPIHQDNNNIKNLVHINNLTRTSLSDYNNSNVPKNKDPKIGKHSIDTLSMNQDHPRNASLHNKNNNIDLTIFHENIRGLYNKVDELVNSCKREFSYILCLTEHHLRNHEINSTCIQ
jgi:hypothetical protein